MVEIPSEQDSWLGDVDHEEVYDAAGLETDRSDVDGGRSRAARILNALGW